VATFEIPAHETENGQYVMKFSPAILTTYFQGESAKSNIRLLLRFSRSMSEYPKRRAGVDNDLDGLAKLEDLPGREDPVPGAHHPRDP